MVGDELDDFYDSLRYGVYSYITADDAVKPVEVKIAEAMQKYTDPTMAMLKRQEVIKEAEQEYEREQQGEADYHRF